MARLDVLGRLRQRQNQGWGWRGLGVTIAARAPLKALRQQALHHGRLRGADLGRPRHLQSQRRRQRGGDAADDPAFGIHVPGGTERQDGVDAAGGGFGCWRERQPLSTFLAFHPARLGRHLGPGAQNLAVGGAQPQATGCEHGLKAAQADGIRPKRYVGAVGETRCARQRGKVAENGEIVRSQELREARLRH